MLVYDWESNEVFTAPMSFSPPEFYAYFNPNNYVMLDPFNEWDE